MEKEPPWNKRQGARQLVVDDKIPANINKLRRGCNHPERDTEGMASMQNDFTRLPYPPDRELADFVLGAGGYNAAASLLGRVPSSVCSYCHRRPEVKNAIDIGFERLKQQRTHKVCPGCKENKPIAEFGYRSGGKFLTSLCPLCVLEYSRRRRAKDPERHREREREYESRPEVQRRNRIRHVAKLYGITSEEYEALESAQGSACAICRKEHPKLHVDHCHDTGKVRGLLCPGCNVGLARFDDSIEGLQRAIDYLRR